MFGIPGMLGIVGNEPGGEGGEFGSDDSEQAQETLESPNFPLWLARSDGIGHGFFCDPTVGFGRERRHIATTMTMMLFTMVKEI